jgi:outer membrane protein TolC
VRAGALVFIALVLSGCTPARYRNWADDETYPILAERVVLPEFDVGRTQLEADPASRLFDPFDPDCPPRPPDDPAASQYMQRPGGFRGGWGWSENCTTDLIEPPGWEMVLEPSEDGTIRLDQDRAVAAALLNSREYQTALEDLYLVALRLTLNRFEFDLQWFLTNSTDFTHFGGGSPAETNTLQVDTNVGFTRNLAAGGQLFVDFANSFVAEFTGGRQQWRSNFLVRLIQPLLRGAGRDVRLESLTQAERDVLYAVRDFARFRKRFWADVAIDRGGYLDLLLALQTVRNNQANLKRQEETYRLYSELFAGGRASAVELDQFFQSLQGARLDVINSETQLNNLLDAFKLRLGLPPRIPVELDDSLLGQFVLVDPELEQTRDALEVFQRARLAELDEPPTVENLQQHFNDLIALIGRGPPGLDRAQADLAEWGRRLARDEATADPETQERARRTFKGFQQQAPTLATELADVRRSAETHRGLVTEATRLDGWEALSNDVKLALATIDSIVAMQTQAKIHLIELPTVSLAEEVALATAKESRLDLQNQLGEVTDAWRKVHVAANALKADLDVVASANFGTDPDRLNPLAFAAEASTYTVGLEFDGPLNRMAERNVYRASLIAFQRARRDFMGLSDQIELDVRRDLRLLAQLRTSFEISRQQLLSAARQFESARIILLGPRDRRSANDTTTLNLLQALTALVQARNALAQNYINYEQQRVQLLLDLEALQLDPQGFPRHDTYQPERPGVPAEELPRPPANPEAAAADGNPAADVLTRANAGNVDAGQQPVAEPNVLPAP